MPRGIKTSGEAPAPKGSLVTVITRSMAEFTTVTPESMSYARHELIHLASDSARAVCACFFGYKSLLRMLTSTVFQST
jgi:hypothetical protein